MRQIHLTLCAAISAMLVFAGCRQALKPEGFPPIYSCTIMLTQEGKPLTDAEVILYSDDDSCPWAVTGTTDSAGVAKIRTHGRFGGAPGGRFIVTVSKLESENANQGEIRTKPIFVYTFVDKKYMNPSTSTLDVEIKKKGNRFEFDLGPSERKLYETISPTGA